MIKAVVFITLFAIFSALISAVDIKTGMIPRVLFIAAFPLFAALKMLLTEDSPPLVAIGGALPGLVVFLLARYFSGGRLGLADVWYSALIGLVLGPVRWYAAIGLACVLGALYILVSKQQRIPFTPMMALGSITVGFIQGFGI